MRVAAAVDVNLGFSFCESGLALRAVRWTERRIRPGADEAHHRRVAIEATAAGYSALYTPDWRGAEALALCEQRWLASCGLRPGGMTVGTMVSPIPKYPDPESLARRALALARATGGRFELGLGAGDLDRAVVRDELGYAGQTLPDIVRGYVQTVIAALDAGAGETFERPPVLLAAMGPRMLRLAGELADGVVLAFATPAEVKWARQHVAEGAERAGRDPAAVRLLQSVPVCIARDEARARRRLAVAVLPYLIGPEVPRPGAIRVGYRRQIERLGFAPLLDELDGRNRSGASTDELLPCLPDALLDRLGYAGPPEGAAGAVARLCAGLDEAVVRITAVSERPRDVSRALAALRPGPGWVPAAGAARRAYAPDRPAPPPPA